MRVTLHVGLHFAGAPRLIAGLRANNPAFEAGGTFVPRQKEYRAPVADILQKLDGLPPIEAEQIELLSQILKNRKTSHLLMSDVLWAGALDAAFSEGRLYADLGVNVARVAELFDTSDVRIAISLRDPVGFVSDALSTPELAGKMTPFLRNCDTATLGWEQGLQELRAALPTSSIVAWREEDAPLIWPRVLRELGRLPRDAPVARSYAPLRQILSAKGMRQLFGEVASTPPVDDIAFENLVRRFLAEFAVPDNLPDRPVGSVNIPGWSQEAYHGITQRYWAQTAAFGKEEGVTFIAPLSEGEDSEGA
ncbi:hypothetical protein [Celeribacter arenosi]|uniref:Sulfotransferase family protein n=1 Tax=Celeribacter arenosi TaxID=792649 RepID=A0ABP7K625_9RHOB